MIKLNDNNIVVGQIKQLLHTFNLPQCQIGDAYPKPGKHFIVENHIMRWDDAKNIIPCERYVYGKEYLNLTTTMPINNMLYDSQTHRYLGRYLRFLRDYSKIDLMCMYNCWDGTVTSKEINATLSKSITTQVREGREVVEQTEVVNKKISFRSGDDDCIVYQVPISITDFTIAIHGAINAEICIYIDAQSSDSAKKINDLINATYKRRRVNDNFIYSPFSAISDAELWKFISENIDNLYLLIKMPRNVDTSVVVLEGIYLNEPEDLSQYFTYKLVTEGSNVEYIAESSKYEIAAQLLSRKNVTSKYLLSDRLIEYLSGNVISPLSDSYEIARLQKSLNLIRSTTPNSDPAVNRCRRLYKTAIGRIPAAMSAQRHIGIWHESELIDLRNIARKSNAGTAYDALGYLDKDLEVEIKGVLDNVEA